MALAAFDAPLSYRDWLAFPDPRHQQEPVAQAEGPHALDHTLPFAVPVVPDELVVGAPG